MPTDDADTLQQETGEATDGSGTDEATPQTEKLFFGKYKTQEEAEKAWQERESLMGRHADELGRLRAETEALRQRAEMKQVLEAITASKKQPDEPIPFEKFEAELAEAARNDPGEGLKKALRTQLGWLNEAEKKSRGYADERIVPVLEEIKALRATIEKLDPDYQANKDIIEKMVSDGMPISKAKEWAKRLKVQSEPSQSMTPPSTISGSRVIPSNTTKENPYLLTKADRDYFKSQGMTDEQLTQMNEERKARFEVMEAKRRAKGGV